ncbi:methyltransferase family protein [Kordia periserrulae]|uniref:Methyltransferase family protein n=1 Tax=Kordia periserrulae TaxID=701523 RepID=A0A2T6BVJ3_9FLAO|nr:methyltransferase domain-containing protein [Kordia periserrulae]PTX60089.1 methyltransferase family protein [Kordia periserrulae]
MNLSNSEDHWNNVYESKEDTQLGWFEEHPKMTLDLIAKTSLSKDAKILNVGAGTTTLIDALLEKNYTSLLASDISEVAMQKLQQRISKKYAYNLECIVDDLTNPIQLNALSNIDLWIDRAVLHFFLKEEEQASYFDLIKKIIRPKGYVLIAVFSLNGAEKCSGLPLFRYNTEMLSKRLGSGFSLIESFNYVYTNPFGGERPYVYALFQKN